MRGSGREPCCVADLAGLLRDVAVGVGQVVGAVRVVAGAGRFTERPVRDEVGEHRHYRTLLRIIHADCVSPTLGSRKSQSKLLVWFL